MGAPSQAEHLVRSSQSARQDLVVAVPSLLLANSRGNRGVHGRDGVAGLRQIFDPRTVHLHVLHLLHQRTNVAWYLDLLSYRSEEQFCQEFLHPSSTLKHTDVPPRARNDMDGKQGLQAIKYQRGRLQVLDQLRLPHEFVYDDVAICSEAFDSIRSMRVRGAFYSSAPS